MIESFLKTFQDFQQIKETMVFIIDPHKEEKLTNLEFSLLRIEIVAFDM